MENWITLVLRYSDFSVGLSEFDVQVTVHHDKFI